MSKIKEIFEVVGKWLKDNWLIVLLVVSVIALFALSAKGCERAQAYDSLFDHYQEQALDHQRQINEINEIHARERAELDRLLQEYHENMERIEREYREELGRISNRSETRRVTIVREFERDPHTLTSAVRDTFGIPIEE